jgi:hypothetical protein
MQLIRQRYCLERKMKEDRGKSMTKPFKASNYFSSMDEVEKMLDGLKKHLDDEEYQVFKKVLGLAEQEGVYREVEGIGKIDVSIADFIEELNARGYHTLSSCSGISSEHPIESDEGVNGYLSLLLDDKREDVEEVCRLLELPVTEGEIYLQPALTIRFNGETDGEIGEKWEQFRTNLLKTERVCFESAVKNQKK